MSIIKTDSFVSNFKNSSYRFDIRPNQNNSNIFRSIFFTHEQKQKSLPIQSLFQINHSSQPFNEGSSILDKFLASSSKENSISTYHYNWTVCKNSGLSEEEDNPQVMNSKLIQYAIHYNVKIEDDLFKQNVKISDFPKKAKNQTKNIPKNYGKAIISFIDRNRAYIQTITSHFKINYDEFLNDLKMKKKNINTIADLRSLWSNYKYAKCMRVISGIFLRKHALHYIFDSRICTYGSHIKYRQRLCDAVSKPQQFMHIKDY